MPYLPEYDNTGSSRVVLWLAHEKNSATSKEWQKVIELLSEQKNQL